MSFTIDTNPYFIYYKRVPNNEDVLWEEIKNETDLGDYVGIIKVEDFIDNSRFKRDEKIFPELFDKIIFGKLVKRPKHYYADTMDLSKSNFKVFTPKKTITFEIGEYCFVIGTKADLLIGYNNQYRKKKSSKSATKHSRKTSKNK